MHNNVSICFAIILFVHDRFFIKEVISSYLSRLIMKEFTSIEKLGLIHHRYYFKPYFIVFIASYPCYHHVGEVTLLEITCV